MLEKLELPIDIENMDCVSKCWIYNRMAIIRTSPYYRDWITSHYNLFATNGFGFEKSHHEEILIRGPVHMFRLTKLNIVDKLKWDICEGYYVKMMVK